MSTITENELIGIIYSSYFKNKPAEFTSRILEGINELIKQEKPIKVADGSVGLSDSVWWKYEGGPQFVTVDEHLKNIKEYPQLYCMEKPTFKAKYD